MHKRVEGAFRGMQVCVTGATGGIGGRLVEKLVLEHGARVKVLVRDLRKVPRLARMPVELVYGEVTAPADVARAVEGCEVVFHCAHGNSPDPEVQRRINLDGTRSVVEACLRHGRPRLVHASTCRVYGALTPDGDLDETAPYRPSGQAYSDSKLEAEKLVFDAHREHGLPVTAIQPTSVYGPWIAVWTSMYMQRLRKGRMILVDGGEGLCNAVYVDDVADALLLAGVRDEAVGEAFLISDRQPITWGRFHDAFAELIGTGPGVNMSRDEALAFYAEWQREHRPRSVFQELPAVWREEKGFHKRIWATREYQLARRVVHALRPKRPPKPARPKSFVRTQGAVIAAPLREIAPLTPEQVDFFAAKTWFRVEKAQRLLGYEPQFDFARGMEVVGEWARWAGLAPEIAAFPAEKMAKTA